MHTCIELSIKCSFDLIMHFDIPFDTHHSINFPSPTPPPYAASSSLMLVLLHRVVCHWHEYLSTFMCAKLKQTSVKSQYHIIIIIRTTFDHFPEWKSQSGWTIDVLYECCNQIKCNLIFSFIHAMYPIANIILCYDWPLLFCLHANLAICCGTCSFWSCSTNIGFYSNKQPHYAISGNGYEELSTPNQKTFIFTLPASWNVGNDY